VLATWADDYVRGLDATRYLGSASSADARNGLDLWVGRFAAGILRQVNVGRRNRAFEAPDLIEEFAALERRLASPRGDTRTGEPTRRVPRRR
jgi:hypothetical protein